MNELERLSPKQRYRTRALQSFFFCAVRLSRKARRAIELVTQPAVQFDPFRVTMVFWLSAIFVSATCLRGRMIVTVSLCMARCRCRRIFLVLEGMILHGDSC